MQISEQTKVNLPPRIRLATPYAAAQSLSSGGRMVNTCNLSEDYVGYSGWPENLVEKIPSDGLCGKTDEDNLGFTYAQLDKYIMHGTCGILEIDDKIKMLHERNLHKHALMPTFSLTA